MTVDLRTTYLGLDLRSPIVASSSPLTGDVATAVRLEQAGVAAIVLPSLFEEEILHEQDHLDRALDAGTEQFAEALGYFPNLPDLVDAGDRYEARLVRMKRALSIPVIASLNGATPGGWVRHAMRLEGAGADAIELNLYHVAADPKRTAADIEAADLALVRSVREAVSIPVAVKLSPYYSALASHVTALAALGVDGITLFNRFYQPDLDLETREVVARIDLSTSQEVRLPLRWIGILRPQLPRSTSLAATSGIQSGTDVAKALMVGANVAMMASALLRNGPEHVRAVEAGLRAWMGAHEYTSATELRGSASHDNAADPSAFERVNYVRVLRSWSSPADREAVAPA